MDAEDTASTNAHLADGTGLGTLRSRLRRFGDSLDLAASRRTCGVVIYWMRTAADRFTRLAAGGVCSPGA